MVDPVLIFLASILVTMQNMIAIYHTVCACVRGPKFFLTRWGWGTGWHPRNTLLPHAGDGGEADTVETLSPTPRWDGGEAEP